MIISVNDCIHEMIISVNHNIHTMIMITYDNIAKIWNCYIMSGSIVVRSFDVHHLLPDNSQDENNNSNSNNNRQIVDVE